MKEDEDQKQKIETPKDLSDMKAGERMTRAGWKGVGEDTGKGSGGETRPNNQSSSASQMSDPTPPSQRRRPAPLCGERTRQAEAKIHVIALVSSLPEQFNEWWQS